MKKKTRWGIVLLVCLLIFFFSSQAGDESNKNNEFVVYVFKMLGIDLKSALGSMCNFIIRKSGHVTEYMILYIAFYRALSCDLYKSSSLGLGVVLTFIYACTDEFHQLFVHGRAGLFKDVLIDCIGILIVLIALGIKRILKTTGTARY